jgi:E3 ubiquitin-protein ligase UBR3
VNDASLSQLEMVTLLCMGDKTHSQLMELMPERCGAGQSRDFEVVLTKVSIAMCQVYWVRHKCRV